MEGNPAVGEVMIVNDLGLHTRSATTLVKLAQTFSSNIEISTADLSANAKSIMGLLALGARKGTAIRITARGADQEAALEAIRKLIGEGFREGAA